MDLSSLTQTIDNFYNYESNVIKTLILHPYSFTPFIKLKGFEYEDEVNFLNLASKTPVLNGVNNEEFKIEIYKYSVKEIHEITESQSKTITHYNNLIKLENLIYTGRYFETDKGFIMFYDLKEFSKFK